MPDLFDFFHIECEGCGETRQECACHQIAAHQRRANRSNEEWEGLAKEYLRLTGEHLPDPAEKDDPGFFSDNSPYFIGENRGGMEYKR